MMNIKFLTLLFVPFFSFQLFAQQREIPLQGTYNFRDIGGYKTKDGRQIRWGKLYRSAVLSNLTAEDVDLLSQLHIHTIIDFRGQKEVAIFPDKLSKSSNYINIIAGSENDTPDDWASVAADMKKSTTAEGDSGAIQYYRNIGKLGKRYRPMFEALLRNEEKQAIVFHCAGGKDRTGIAAALIEYVLGVDSAQILDDYVLTNKYRERYNGEIASLLHLKYGVPLERAKDYGLAKPEFLNATFQEIKNKYGTIGNYAEKELGLDSAKIDRLKKLYLE